MYNKKGDFIMNKKAFTLAETLITLAIIGVVAALTIPGIVQKYEEKVTVVKVKKVYSLLSNALQLAEFEQGTFNNTGSGYSVMKNYYDYISPYLKIEKYCGTGEGCWPDTMIKFLHGADWVNINTYSPYEKAVMNDGMLLQLYAVNIDNEFVGEIRVDINGYKRPNTLGKDIFYFNTIGSKVIPQGSTTAEESTFATHCNLSSENSYNGDGCTAWVIYNENMDYLHCNDLSWGGKKSCKQKD